MTNLTKGALALSWIHRGYDLKATAESFAACVKCLLGDKLEDEGSSAWPGRPADRYQRTINEVSVACAPFFPYITLLFRSLNFPFFPV